MILAVLLTTAGPFVGSQACQGCHPEICNEQVVSRHANALRRFQGSLLADKLTKQEVAERGGYRYRYRPQGDAVEVVAYGNDEAAAILEWAFGTGTYGMTAVGRRGTGYLEFRITWYGKPQQAGITPGQTVQPSRTAASALGVMQSEGDALRCFNCHSTGAEMTDGGVRMSEAGVRCERCHSAGAAHVEAARAHEPVAKVRRTIFNAGRLSAKAIIETCGGCHRLPQPTDDPTDPVNVRFQPYGLLGSRCFRESGRLSCLTCHNPHQDAIRGDAPFYVSRCLKCHESTRTPVVECERKERANCLPCHMPKSDAMPHLTFTDHRIRVYSTRR